MMPLNHKKFIAIGLFIALLNTIVFKIWPTTASLFASLFDPASLSGFGFIIPVYAFYAVGLWIAVAFLYKWALKLLKQANTRHHIQVFIVAQLLFICAIMLLAFIFSNGQTVESGSSIGVLLLLSYFCMASLEVVVLYLSNLLVSHFIKD